MWKIILDSFSAGGIIKIWFLVSGRNKSKCTIDKPNFISIHQKSGSPVLSHSGDISGGNSSYSCQTQRTLSATLFSKIPTSRGCVRYIPFLLILGIVFFQPSLAQAGFFSDIVKFFSGGTPEPQPERAQTAISTSLPLLGSRDDFYDAVGGVVEDFNVPLSATQNNALVASRNPLGIIEDSGKDQIVVYTVQPGDTPGGIAANFGISLNTLLWANNIHNPNLIRNGDELIILPVTGVYYTVKNGDTLASIAKKFNGDLTEILNFNGLAVDESLKVGVTIIIPDGEIDRVASALPQQQSVKRYALLPDAEGFFRKPIFGGRKSRGLHGYNAVDLAQTCGRPVLASAAGTVIIARLSGWNGGYGNYLVLEHQNGTQTLYAHVQSILARAGQEIAQGSQIATVGTTGNSTGCHVHFEIRGAKNPF